MERLDDAIAGTIQFGGQTIELVKGHGLPPGSTATGHIDDMAMYAGESVALIHDIRNARDVIDALTQLPQPLLAYHRGSSASGPFGDERLPSRSLKTE